MGDGYAASPDGLRYAAKHDLGELIARLEDGKQRLSSTEAHDLAFSSQESRIVQTGNYWAIARQHLVELFDDNIENLELAQQALVEIARRYDTDDEDSGNQVRASGAGLTP